MAKMKIYELAKEIDKSNKESLHSWRKKELKQKAT